MSEPQKWRLTRDFALRADRTAHAYIRGGLVEPKSHNPKAAGSNPAPATKKMQVKGPFQTGEGLLLVGLSADRSAR